MVREWRKDRQTDICTEKLWSGGCADSEEVAPSISHMEPQHVCSVQHIGGVNPSR